MTRRARFGVALRVALLALLLTGCASAPRKPPAPVVAPAASAAPTSAPAPAPAPTAASAPSTASVAGAPASGGATPAAPTGIVLGDMNLAPFETLPVPPRVPAPLRVIAVGDVMLGTDYPTDRTPPSDGKGPFVQVRDLLRDGDVTFGNLEGVLADDAAPVKTCQDAGSCWLFRMPTRLARMLAGAGFDAMSLANNHARDFGEVGRDSSMATLEKAGIKHSGREGDVASWAAGETRVGMVAFTPNPGSWSLLDIPAAVAQVRLLAKDNDFVIVSFHGGGEGADRTHVVRGMETFKGEQRGDLIAFAHAVIDAGAALVLGSGPHVPRALELYKGRLVAYSLGNFATWYGISIDGTAGYAPILDVTLAPGGAFVSGRIHSNRQQRPEGVVPDPQQHAFRLMRQRTNEDFGGGGLRFAEDGSFAPR